MAKIKYVPRKFTPASLEIVERADAICQEYANDDYVITLRQLYYQFVARGHLGNTQENYKRLGSIVNDARLAGLLDWKHMEDRTRNLQSNSHWNSPQSILSSCAYSFRLDKWATQSHYVEVWVEKEALAGVVERAARDLDVAFFSCRGYVSQSEMHAAALRFKHYNSTGRAVRIIHLGDHDPSGIDMTRDVTDRMAVFGVKDVRVDRIALNMDQVEQYNPPPNPVKATDARFSGYQEKYGDESWELDALEPKVLGALIRDAVTKYRDNGQYNELVRKEERMRQALTECHNQWPRVAVFLGVPDAAKGLDVREYDADEDRTGMCNAPDHDSDSDDDDIWKDGVCIERHNKGWRECSECHDHVREEYTHRGLDDEPLCIECFENSYATCSDCYTVVAQEDLDEGRCEDCNDAIDHSGEEEDK